MIKAGIVGVSGYSGKTLLDKLLRHKMVRITYVSANNTQGKITDIWPEFTGLCNLNCTQYDPYDLIKNCDIAFLAVPHTIAMKIAPKLLSAGIKVIDLSADYRLNNASQYKKWYKTPHLDTRNLRKAVYGLPELYKEKIKKANLIANPGCYPTGAILALAPILTIESKNIISTIIDAKSGTSGAGKKASVGLNFTEVNENFKAYKVLCHQHNPEIDVILSNLTQEDISVEFVPHLLPISRGIQETIYVHLNKKISLPQIHTLYKRFYKTEPFVRILPLNQQPEIKNVAHTNFCDIGLAINEKKNMLVITSVIDNLLKGASGQAVQNMNLMYEFNETEGLL